MTCLLILLQYIKGYEAYDKIMVCVLAVPAKKYNFKQIS